MSKKAKLNDIRTSEKEQLTSIEEAALAGETFDIDTLHNAWEKIRNTITGVLVFTDDDLEGGIAVEMEKNRFVAYSFRTVIKKTIIEEDTIR